MFRFILAVFVVVLSTLSCQASKIKVGSRDFPESVLIAEILSSAIERYTEHNVDRKFNLGGVKINIAAMQSNDLDIYPDYTGSLIHNILGEHDEKQYLRNYLEETLKQKYRLNVSERLGFDNSFVLATRKDFAQKYNLKTLTDLKDLINSNKLEPKAALKHSFIKRPDGYQKLQEIYGLDFKNLRAMEYNIAQQQLLAKRIDIIDAFSTDSRLKNKDLLTLKDDRNALLAYDAIYVSRDQVINKHPELKGIFSALSQSLNNQIMLELNARIERGETYQAVATDFLKRLENNKKINLNIIKKSIKQKQSWNWIKNERLKQDLPILSRAFMQHLSISLIAALLAAFFGIILGILISYNAVLAKLVLGLAAVTQTIPSLALLALLIPIVGLGFYPALVALFIYALLPVIQNTYTGIKNIDPHYIELAQSLALREPEILTKVKIPMAMTSIIAGVKISLVICIGTATLATFVGGGGLGDLIKAGIDLNSNYMICLGAIPAALLALSANLALSKVETAVDYRS